MSPELVQTLAEGVPHFEGYVYPNEIHLLWSVLMSFIRT
jgi:hypothetical protein